MFSEVFTYESCEFFNDGEIINFFKCKLRKPVGKYFIGTEIERIVFFYNIDEDGSVIQIYRLSQEELSATYKIHLRVGDLI